MMNEIERKAVEMLSEEFAKVGISEVSLNLPVDAACVRAISRALAALVAEARSQQEAAAALEAARVDAERWRHARRILTVEDIESSQGMFKAFGFKSDEHENRKADAAIDRALREGGKEDSSD